MRLLAATAVTILLALTAPRPAAAQTAAPAVPAAIGQVVETDDHFITKVADDAYVLRHRRAARLGASSGNTTIVIGARDVLVVDSCLLPSIAKDDIALIKQWTSKPVRYLVNTHWHGDHTWGNSAYREAFPGVTIISHAETPARMMGFLPNFLPRNIALPDHLRKMIAEGKDADGAPADEAKRKETAAMIPNAELRAAEYKTLVTIPPDVTFDDALTLDLGGREVRLLYLGRGNTAGDAIVYLPREGVVAAGDLLVYPFPYLYGGFPADWAKTLTRLERLGAQTIVPGHGAVLMGAEGPAYLDRVRGLLASVSEAVWAETFKVGNIPLELAKVEAAVLRHPDLPKWRDRFAAGNAETAAAMDPAFRRIIAAAYREIWGS